MIKKNNKKHIVKDLLLALVPYTRQNILFIFKPNQFFDELDKTSEYNNFELRKTFSRVKSQKLIAIEDDHIVLSLKAKQIVQSFLAEKLSNEARLMVIFDIPEDHANRRRRFRYLLRHFDFVQIQQSVWMSDKDYREILFESINEIEITQWVQLYEASKIESKK